MTEIRKPTISEAMAASAMDVQATDFVNVLQAAEADASSIKDVNHATSTFKSTMEKVLANMNDRLADLTVKRNVLNNTLDDVQRAIDAVKASLSSLEKF